MPVIAPEHKTLSFLHSFASSLARELSALDKAKPWRYDTKRNRRDGETTSVAYLTGPIGETIYLSLNSHEGKITAQTQTRLQVGNTTHGEVSTPYGFKTISRGCSVTSSTSTFARALKTHGVLGNAALAHTHMQERL